MDNLLDALKAHAISLSEDEVGHEIVRALELSGGLPVYVRPFLGAGPSDVPGFQSADTPVGARFVDFVDKTISIAEEGELESGSEQQLTREQVELFRSGCGRSPIDPRARAVLELAAIQATALTVEQAATVLGASADEVRGSIDAGVLYGIEAGGAWLLPIFQLDDEGHSIPHVEEVLPLLNRTVRPVGILHWFTDPYPDLASEETHYASLSPKTWLLRKLPTEPVPELAKHVA